VPKQAFCWQRFTIKQKNAITRANCKPDEGNMNELDKTRAKIVGILIKDARLFAGRSHEDCAKVLGIEPSLIVRAEIGEHVLSLPDLEVLAMYLKVPLAHFWGDKVLNKPHRAEYGELARLRQQIIGGQLRRARVETGRTQQEVADVIKADVALVQAYETGEVAVPLFELERMGKYVGVSLDYFLDRTHGPLAEHETEQKVLQRFWGMPEEMRHFVSEPFNRSYIETALHLSKLDVNRLRSIAEGILDITF